MITIYHNNRCRKSREGLEIIANSGEDYKLVEYMKDPLSQKQLEGIVEKLDISPIDLVRKNEAIWREKYRGRNLSDSEIIQAMCDFPKLIERPIVIRGNSAVIGRPPEKIKGIL